MLTSTDTDFITISRTITLQIPKNSVPVPNFEDYYITSNGEIWSTHKHIGWIKQSLHAGYYTVTLYNGDSRKRCKVHLLVLEAYIGPRPHGLVGCHNNGISTDNRVENLRWDTYKSNSKDQQTHGTLACGERNGNSKLSEGDIKVIFKLKNDGIESKEIAKQYGVSPSNICCILRRKTWKHVNLSKNGD